MCLPTSVSTQVQFNHPVRLRGGGRKISKNSTSAGAMSMSEYYEERASQESLSK